MEENKHTKQYGRWSRQRPSKKPFSFEWTTTRSAQRVENKNQQARKNMWSKLN